VRINQKKWSHINPSVITPLDDEERNHFSLRVKLSVCHYVCEDLSSSECVTLSLCVCLCVVDR